MAQEAPKIRVVEMVEKRVELLAVFPESRIDSSFLLPAIRCCLMYYVTRRMVQREHIMMRQISMATGNEISAAGGQRY